MGIVEQAKNAVKQKHKEANAVKNKAIIETAKTIVLTAALTLLIAGPFILFGGFQFGKSSQSEVQTQVKDIVSNINTESSKK
jgi:hypothetical protein